MPGRDSCVGGPFGSELTREDYRECGVPVIRGNNLNADDGVFKDHDFAFVDEAKANSLRRNMATRGDLVFTQRGSLGQCAIVPHDAQYERYVISQSQMRVRPDLTKVVPTFLFHYMRSAYALRVIEKRTLATGVPHINLGILREFPIPCPPLVEQRRVGAILDKAESIRRKRQEAISLGEALLRSTFLELFGDPVTNPKRWPVKPLGSLAVFTGGGTPPRAVPTYFTGKTCWATSKDMKGEVLHDTEEHITADAIENCATKLVPAGTILVVVKSKILMRRLPVLIAAVPTCFGQDLKGITLARGQSTTFVARHLRLGEKILLDVARGANTEGLTLDHLRRFPVMQPPAVLIQRFDEIEARIVRLRTEQERFLKDAEDLFGALAQQFFAPTAAFSTREAA